MKMFYRIRDYSVYDRGVAIMMMEYKVIKETPCGYWIYPIHSNPDIHGNGRSPASLPLSKWVSKTSRKRYAYPTPAEAMESFISRKLRQIALARAQIKLATGALNSLPDRTAREQELIDGINYQNIADIFP